MKIKIHEVGMRDGLQMEKKIVTLQKKIEWVDLLLSARMTAIQLGSFVHPKRVPQMADTDQLFHHFSELAGTVFSGLVLNEKGVERGLACGVGLYCMGVSASETHSRRNVGVGIEEALRRTLSMASLLIEEGKDVQVSVQSAFGCGYEGPVSVARVLEIVHAYLEAGLCNVSLADTAGHASPLQVKHLLQEFIKVDPDLQLACHFHDTYGMGLANCVAAFEEGVTVFETAFGGLGGCPFTAKAGGNVCTEDLVHMFQRMGCCDEIQLEPILQTAREAAEYFDHPLPGKLCKVGPISADPAPVEQV